MAPQRPSEGPKLKTATLKRPDSPEVVIKGPRKVGQLMTQAQQQLYSPARIHVIATPIPSVRLLRIIEAQLREMYDDLLIEPIPARMTELVRRQEATTRRGGSHDGTDA
jgi:Anti-sigma factor NepR